MTLVSCAGLIAGIRSGLFLGSFPTDTVPALAARPDQAALIYQAKQRQMDKPLILMGADPESLWPYVKGVDSAWPLWQKMAINHWPGALTLVLPASSLVPQAMNPLDPQTIGVRVPNSNLARDILRQTGPLATTSVNRSGQPTLLTQQDINQQFPDVLTLPANCWSDQATTVPSTVIKWTGEGWLCLRQGSVQVDEV